MRNSCCLFFREDKDDQVLDSKQEIQTMEEQLRKLQKEVESRTGMFLSRIQNKTSMVRKQLSETMF